MTSMGTEIARERAATVVVDALGEARERTLALVESIGHDDLERVHSTLMSPLVWDLGHIAAFEDLWLNHRYGDRPLLRDDLADVYDAFETPRAGRGDLPFLGPDEAKAYMEEVRARTLEVIEERGPAGVHELVIRHEQQHNETMLQTMQLAHLDPRPTVLSSLAGQPASQATNGTRAATGTGDLQLIHIPGGPVLIGAPPDGFAYDNERPRHRTDVRGYLIGRSPVTNGSYLTFVEGGGYQRREWWSDEGWAWKEEYDITRPAGWTEGLDAEWRLGRLEPLQQDRPVVHVSWFEADAFARAHDARLPTEPEWEKAATWNQHTGTVRRYPWGDDPPLPGIHANVDLTHPGTAPAQPSGASSYGCEQMIGDVWEWTASEFRGYPGFEPFPYREYSEVFFGPDYRVLRGGSWATRARVITPTFRNWDYPQRRQIFAGVRIAKDETQ
jgi:gamma-glutamyl hercynylcysteine S-oxide synthase